LGEREQEILKVFYWFSLVTLRWWMKNVLTVNHSVGYKKSYRMCNWEHQNGSISHMWKMHHLAGESHGNRFDGKFLLLGYLRLGMFLKIKFLF
jgi:hypothetical protein